MIDSLAGKTRELIIMESDPNMMSWLQEWKRQTVDMETENRFELWEDEKEVSEDLENESLLHLANSAQFIGGESIQGGSTSTTTHGIASPDIGTRVVLNTVEST
jgi:hypothetical protein